MEKGERASEIEEIVLACLGMRLVGAVQGVELELGNWD